MHYCETWLTEKDPWLKELQPAYAEIFKKSPPLKDLPIAEAIEKFKTMSKPVPIIQHQRWTINTDAIQATADYTGSFNAEQDSDGTIRKASLFFRTGNRIGTSFIPSMALQTFLISTGYRANVEINVDPKHPEQKKLTKFDIVDPSKDPEEFIASVPVDAQGRMNINYAGGRNMYAYLPAKELFNGKETALISQAQWNPETKRWNPAEFEVKKADFIKGKSFVFGATAIGIYDLRVTPYEKNYPGPETHLSTLGNLFSHNFLRAHPQENSIMLWALLVFGILLSFAISHTTAIPGFLITFCSFLAMIFIDQWFFRKGLLVTMTLPGGLVLFLYIFLFFYKYLTEERKKKHLRRVMVTKRPLRKNHWSIKIIARKEQKVIRNPGIAVV
jgi:adenylate cyclase